MHGVIYFSIQYDSTMIGKKGYLLGLLHFEAGMDTNVQHLQVVTVRLSHVSEHASARFGLVDARTRAHGCLPPPPFYSPCMTFIFTLNIVGLRHRPAIYPCFQDRRALSSSFRCA
jgi:hypothetical protein